MSDDLIKAAKFLCDEKNAEIERLRAELNQPIPWAVERDLRAEIERLREALQAVVDDVLEYERINKLSPSPGKPDCWQSITNAKAALRPRERND